ncbi:MULTISPECIES: hypothetical protein [unclassified Streptomyces]|uniref:hypothetical protein n=1 Tax=unclassified Streptomyces TaxID=2593676 RepID=UPI0006F7BC5F|nr:MULTISPECIES: hypothetical protein [unclassified Streptomyces]KQX57848.1 hypothetical protein ASD33_25405 [Streptomyces sp. Root1304]KRA78732.1 hypothetical protein ASE09_22960 [Streptomyces sp. Root66D1]
MRPQTPSAGDHGSPVEERLRAALAARAALVTYRELRRDEPPQGRAWGTRRVRGLAFAGLGAAAAVAAAYLLGSSPGGALNPAPEPPARPPGVVIHPKPETTPLPTPGPVGPSVKTDAAPSR